MVTHSRNNKVIIGKTLWEYPVWYKGGARGYMNII